MSMVRNVRTARLAAAALALALILPAAGAWAASDYNGIIGRIDVRTGSADTAVYRYALVIRDESASIVCVLAADVENYAQFQSIATAAMLAGKNVTIARGGSLNGQFKCYQIQVRD